MKTADRNAKSRIEFQFLLSEKKKTRKGRKKKKERKKRRSYRCCVCFGCVVIAPRWVNGSNGDAGGGVSEAQPDPARLPEHDDPSSGLPGGALPPQALVRLPPPRQRYLLRLRLRRPLLRLPARSDRRPRGPRRLPRGR